MTFIDLPYQREGADWLASQARAGLADEQRVGKAVQAIMACDKVGAQRIAVVCPAKATHQWRAQFERFGRPLAYRQLRVLSYEEATKVFGAVSVKTSQNLADVVILDEAHRLKNPTSQRTTAIYPKLQYVDYVWALTGTPMPNDPSELWTHFRWLKPHLIPAPGKGAPLTYEAFRAAFCEMKRGFGGEPQVVGVKNLDVLKPLVDKLWLRRMLADVQPQLPKMRYGEIVLKSSKQQDVREVHEISAHLPKEKYDRLITDPDSLPVGDEELSSLRRLVAEAKAGALADYLREELETYPEQKIVVFAWHTNALDRLARDLRKFGPVIVDGRTKNPTAAVAAFQNDPESRVCLGQIVAAGTALDFTAASDVIFLELSWTPVENWQAQSRILGIDQKAQSCLCRTVVLKDSIDEAVTRVLARKSRMIEETMNRQAAIDLF